MAEVSTWNQAYELGHKHGEKIQEKAMSGPAGMMGGMAGGAGGAMGSKHSGGRIKKTGNYRLRKKELVLTVAQQKAAGLQKGGKKKANARKRVASKG
jgi:hypothetical protein